MRGLQPLVLTPVRQKLDPEIPPRTPVPLVRGVQPPVLTPVRQKLDPEIPRRELAPPVRGVEIPPRTPVRPVHALGFLPRGGERERLEAECGRRGPVDEPGAIRFLLR